MKQEPVVLCAAGPIRANDTISQARLAESEVLEPETRDMRIVPAGLMESPPAVVTTRKSEPDRMLRLGLQPPNAQLELPLFARQYDTALRASPLLLADAAGFRGLTPGVGARLDKRLWMYALLHAPITQRQVPVVYHWTPTLEELNALVWDTQWRVRKAERLEAALDAVTLAKVQLPNGRLWRPVVVMSPPDYNDPQSHAFFQLTFPPNSEYGPAVNLPLLIEQGKISDPAFDLCISLAYLWDDAKRYNGRNRVYVGESGVRRVHPLSREERRFMAYGPKSDASRQRIGQQQDNADRLLRKMAKIGYVKVLEVGNCWRILEVRRAAGQRAELVAGKRWGKKAARKRWDEDKEAEIHAAANEAKRILQEQEWEPRKPVVNSQEKLREQARQITCAHPQPHKLHHQTGERQCRLCDAPLERQSPVGK